MLDVTLRLLVLQFLVAGIFWVGSASVVTLAVALWMGDRIGV